MLSVGASLVLATMYLVVVRGSTPAFAALPGAFLPGFVLLTALRTVNSLTDSAFMGLRAPHVNLWVSGVGQGLLKNAFPLLFAGAGATGIFLSYTVAGAVAAVVSALLLVGRYRVPVLLRVHRQTLQEVWSFSTSSYVAYLLHMLPIIVLPLVIIEARGSAEAGYYYLAFTCANLIYIAVYAVSQTLITEHSYEAGDLRGPGRPAERSSRRPRLGCPGRRRSPRAGRLRAAVPRGGDIGARGARPHRPGRRRV